MKYEAELRTKMHPTLNLIVREDGAVYNCGHYANTRKWTYGRLNDKGYTTIKLNGTRVPVHRLVAETFLPNPQNKPTVDHINRIRNDNSVRNLRWATRKEQQDNTSLVLNSPYGVRACEDKDGYMKKWRASNKSNIASYGKERRKKKQEDGFKDIVTANGRKWIPKDIAEELVKLPISERFYP